ncbi:hypothetical protein LC55x_1147 [Lysobacter capsici]|nr:hypothetical protein LC55x_1147 [Lysobacter capsici]
MERGINWLLSEFAAPHGRQKPIESTKSQKKSKQNKGKLLHLLGLLLSKFL